MRYIPFLIMVIITINAYCQPGFIENKGQWHTNALYKTEIPGGSLFLEKEGLTYNFVDSKDIQKSHNQQNTEKKNDGIVHMHSYKVKFCNTLKSEISSTNVNSDYTNYFIGNDSKKWASKALRYNSVKYSNIYQNIDFKIYVNEQKFIQYDFIVNPGGNSDDIRLSYEGQDELYVDADGSLAVKTSISKTTELKPFAYQEIDGNKVKIPCKFLIRNGKVAFQFPEDYNHNYALIIDPILVFSTYSGATSDNWGFTATFDEQSNVFSGGICFNIGYPTSIGAYQVNYAGGSTDITIIKYDATGIQRLWATYIGGTTSAEMPHSLVSDRKGDLILFGTTGSSDFPMTANSYDNTFNGGTALSYDGMVNYNNGIDIFVSKLSADGSLLLGSTYVGGSDNDGLNFRTSYVSNLMTGNGALYYNYADGARGEVICDGNGNIYVGSCTFSGDFPTTAGSFNNAYSGNQEGVVFKLNIDLSQLLWSSYFGGSNDDAIYSLDLDYNGEVYIGGGTTSNNIQTTTGVYQSVAQGGSADGFFAHISANGSNLIKSSYFGSTLYDQVYFIRVDKSLNVYLTGQTKAAGSTFISSALYGTPNSGQFIAKFPNNLSTPIWSTVFGSGIGKPNISLTAFSVDYCNRIYLAGWGREWANYGDPNWIIDGTHNMDVTANAFQSTTDGQDFYLMVMADDASHLEYATFFGEQHQAGNSGYCGHDHVDGGTSRFDKLGNIYQSVCASCGMYSSGLSCNGFPTSPSNVWSPNNGGSTGTTWNCNNAVFKFSFELPLTIADFNGGPVCANDTIHFTNSSQLATNYNWNFGDGSSSTAFEPTHVYTNSGLYNVTLVASHPTSCNLADSITRLILVEQLSVNTTDVSICSGNPININATVTGTTSNVTYLWSTNTNFSPVLNSNHAVSSLNVNPSQTTTYYIHASSQICDIIDSVTVFVYPVGVTMSTDTAVCAGNQFPIHAINNVVGDTLSYVWWPGNGIISGQGTSQLQILPSQNTWYYVSVTNQHNCTKIDSVNVIVDQFTLSPGPVINVNCFGHCNGSLYVYPNNGLVPYTYHWSNGDTSSVAHNLCPNSYSVTVTDAIGCIHILPFVITQPPLLNATISTLTTASCDPVHPNTGSAVVTPSGGTPGYTYNWNNVYHDSLITDLFVGIYNVTITDANGCDTILATSIVDQSNLALHATSISTLCYGTCDGSASASVTSPGLPPYSYLWNTNSIDPNISNLCSGYYVVSVTDAEFCVRVQGVFVNQPDSIVPIITTPGINCFGGTTSATGSVIHGGTSPYTYSWSTTETGPTINGLTPGTYWLYVLDAHNCPDSTFINITQPFLLTYDTTITPVACAVACNGSIQLPVYGGTLSYYFNWSNGMHSSTISDLCSGNYDVTVTDAKGCSFIEDFQVGVSDYLPDVDATTNNHVIYVGQSTQLFAISNSNFQFSWTPAGTVNGFHLQNPIASPTESTTYQVIIQDSYGCSNTDTVSIIVMDVICGDPYIYIPNAFTPNNDGQNDKLYVKAEIASKLYFAIYDRWGEKVFSTTDVNYGWDGTYKGKALDPAVFVYYLKVTCINNLLFEKKGNITLIR